MDTIKIGIKRFFKNKNTVTIIAVILCLFILYWAYNYRIQKKTDPVSVPYALREIQPRTLVTSEMIGTVKVPKSMVTSNVLNYTSQVIGKYVSSDAVIPAGSLFYSKVLVTWDELPSSLYADIPEGYTVVSLPVTLDSTYGNSIFPGNYIDLYFVTTSDNSKLLLGKLIESIKVLAVVDSDGQDVFEKSSDLNAPAYLIFAVSEEYHLLLRKASYLAGTIFPIPRNADYSLNPGNTKISSSYLQNYILSQTVNVAEEDLKSLEPDDNVIIDNNNNGTGNNNINDISNTDNTTPNENEGGNE